MSQGWAEILGEFVTRYGGEAGAEGPVLFATEVFGARLDPWQEEVLRDYGRGERRITIRACHGPGKTWVASVCIWHQLLTRFPQKTVVTAPSKAQLEDALFAEVKTLFGKLPVELHEAFEVKQNRIEMKAAPDESFLSARTARAETPEALQGVHCDEGYVLLIADEASGVPEAVFNSAKGSMSGHRATTMLLSNPMRGSGYFFDSHTRNKHLWKPYHVKAQDSSRVTQDFVQQVLEESGGEDSAEYRIRVLGEFPKADDDTVIPLEFVESARLRDIVVRPGLREVWGLDVARFGDDANALVRRNALAVLPDIDLWRGQDLMQTTGRVKAKWDDTPSHERPEWILVDVIGLGAGVLDRLRELGLPARGINVGESASTAERYANLRSELWFKGRDWLGTKDHKLPMCEGGCARDCLHELLAGELVRPRFSFSSNGKRAVESKDDMRKRGIKSPNLADAFLLTLAVDVAGMIHGTAGNSDWGSNWNEPVRLNRSMV